MAKIPKLGERRNGTLSAALYGGIPQQRRRDRAGELVGDAPAVHGEAPPAIDRSSVLTEWRRLWRLVLRDLTPLQRRALELELGTEPEEDGDAS